MASNELAIAHEAVQKLKSKSKVTTTRAHFARVLNATSALGSVGWRDLGAASPGSQAFDISKDIFEVLIGAPRSVQDRHITAWMGNVSIELYDYKNQAVAICNGTKVGTDWLTLATVLDTTIDASNSTIKNIALATIGPTLLVGDYIRFQLVTLNANFTDYETARVVEIQNTTAPFTVTIEGKGLSVIPDDGAEAIAIARETQPIGGNDLEDYRWRTLTSMNNGELVVVSADVGQFIAPVNLNMGDSSNVALLPLQFGAIAQPRTIPGFAQQQLVIFDHHLIYKL